MKISSRKFVTTLSILTTFVLIIGCGGSSHMMKTSNEYAGVQLDTVKAGRFDTGKMWTFDNPPVEYFKEAYNFQPSQDWLDNVRLAALRFANYCSASFVSADGLVMTNHHCGRQSVEQVSKEGENLLTNGFYAKTIADERKVPGLFVEQLEKIDDVTSEIQAAIEKGKTDEERNDNKRKAIADAEKRFNDQTKLRCQVVSMYNGGKYSMYCYKRYDDVRVVFAPELALGFFGGDPDNFTYPRYTYDCTFFRVYQDSVTPLKPKNFYPFSSDGAKPGEPVFIVGNPGRTTRLNTVAQLEYTRDVRYPGTIKMLKNRMDILQEQMTKNPEKKEALINQYFGMSNSHKAITGYLGGLQDPILMARKKDFEKKFRSAVAAKPELKAKYGKIWDEIAECRTTARTISPELNVFQFANPMRSQILGFAGRAVDYAHQASLPDDQREKANRGAGLNSFKFRVKQSVSPNVDLAEEKKLLAAQLDEAIMMLGADDPFIVSALKGKSPKEAAVALLDATSLKDSSARVALLESGLAGINASTDPLIVLARDAAPRLRKAQALSKEIQTKEESNVNLLGRALYEVYGTSIPPDATFTLRLADGVVKGYDYNGTFAPPITTFYGMYDRHYSTFGDESWALPDRWINYPKEFNLHTPYNFVCTSDIIGGNSGSPVINKKAHVVGLVFDGNMESLPGDFIFAEEKNRSVALHSKGMLEAMKHIYHADRLVKELTGEK